MLNWKKIIMVFGICLASGTLRGKCRECLSTNSVACLDEVSFVTCKDGKMTNYIVRCPSGHVCTEDHRICIERSTIAQPICYEDMCSTCDLIYGFSCISRSVYGFCYDGTSPDPSSMRKCPSGRVCNLQSPAICVKESKESGGQSSCKINDDEIDTSTTDITKSQTDSTMTTQTVPASPTTETSTQRQPTIDPVTDTSTEPIPTDELSNDVNLFCSSQRREGNFKALNDKTCKEYIYCYLLSNQYLGLRFYCAGYFNAETGRCENGSTRPQGC